jgi:hypothetical protein
MTNKKCDWCEQADRPLAKYSAEPHIAPHRFFCSLECSNSYHGSIGRIQFASAGAKRER